MPELPMFAIYEHPSDFPKHFVVRRWMVGSGYVRPTLIPHALEPTLDEARQRIPPGLTCLDRTRDDDPCIVEVWF